MARSASRGSGVGAGRAGRQPVLDRVFAERRCHGNVRKAARCGAQAAAEPERRPQRQSDCTAERAGSRHRNRGRCRRRRREAGREAGPARGRCAAGRADLVARLHARAVPVVDHDCRASADHSSAHLFPAGLGSAFPAQTGAVRRGFAVAQERRGADPRRGRRAGPALPACHARVECPGWRRHLACVRGAGNGAGGRMGRRRGRACISCLTWDRR